MLCSLSVYSFSCEAEQRGEGYTSIYYYLLAFISMLFVIREHIQYANVYKHTDTNYSKTFCLLSCFSYTCIYNISYQAEYMNTLMKYLNISIIDVQ